MTDEPSAEGSRRAYDQRRETRGGEAPIEISRWKRRLTIGGIAFLSIALALAAGYLWWSLTYVSTVDAAVYCELVELASDVDARLQELYVQPGDHVEKGQAVARLDDSQLIAELDAAEAELAVRKSDLTQQEAGYELTKARTQAALVLAEAQVQIAQADLQRSLAQREQFRACFPEQVRLSQARQDEAKAQHQDLVNGTRPERVKALRARLATTEERRKFYKLEVEIADQLGRSGVVSAIEMEQKRTALAVAQNEHTEAQLLLDLALAGATKEELAASQSALVAAQAALALAEKDEGELKRFDAEVAMREAELLEAKARQQQAVAAQREVALAEERLRAAEAQVEKAEANVAQRQAGLSAKKIVSPVAGTVLRTFEEVGEICRKGVPIVFVKDDSKDLWIEGFVAEEDAERLRVGQKAMVEVVAGSWDYVAAEVALISLSTSSVERGEDAAAAAARSRGPSRGESLWVKLRLTGEPDCLVLPGMTARAYLRVR